MGRFYRTAILPSNLCGRFARQGCAAYVSWRAKKDIIPNMSQETKTCIDFSISSKLAIPVDKMTGRPVLAIALK